MWSGVSHLRQNARKTKEIVVDFRMKSSPALVTILDDDIEMLQTYKYLGGHLDDILG